MNYHIFDVNSMLSQYQWISHESFGYYGKLHVDHCDMKNKEYDEDVQGAVYIAPNLQGVFCPVYFVGPEFIEEKLICINTIEEIIQELEEKGLRYIL